MLDKQEFIKILKTGLLQLNEVNIMTIAYQFNQESRHETFKIVALNLFSQDVTCRS
jgi:hypothetical protein